MHYDPSIGDLVSFKLPSQAVSLDILITQKCPYQYEQAYGIVLRKSSTSLSLMGSNINFVNVNYYIVFVQGKNMKIYDSEILDIIGESNV